MAPGGPLILWIIHDHGRPSKSEGIGFGIRVAGLGRSGGIVRAINSSEQSIRPSNQSVRAINQAECCQSLLPMPGATVFAGVKGPRVGPGSALAGLGNQRAWMSGVGAEEQWRSPSRGERVSNGQTARLRGFVCNAWFPALCSGVSSTNVIDVEQIIPSASTPHHHYGHDRLPNDRR